MNEPRDRFDVRGAFELCFERADRVFIGFFFFDALPTSESDRLFRDCEPEAEPEPSPDVTTIYLLLSVLSSSTSAGVATPRLIGWRMKKESLNPGF